MLRLRFFNVGDGDCILVEEHHEGGAFCMLVDAGKDAVSEPAPAAVCAEHLRRAGVSRLDRVVISHLHTDHFGGLDALIGEVGVDELISGYIPLDSGARASLPARAGKSARALADCLNAWAFDVERLREAGARMTQLFASRFSVKLTPRLSADFIVPDVRAQRLQRDVYNRMLRGESVPDNRMLQGARLRNLNSMRMRLRYAGRVIELGADCYGSIWDGGDLAPCDILKVPHHGDVRALTQTLVDKLRPAHAVISCGRDYLPAKDRPSALTIDRLRAAGARVWFTDAFPAAGQPVYSWPSVDFAIASDGAITPPVCLPASSNAQ